MTNIAFSVVGMLYNAQLMSLLGEDGVAAYGLISALISFVRTLVFEIAAVLYLPTVLGTDGIWLSVVVAEVAAFVLSWAFMLAFGRKFGYLGARGNAQPAA